LREIMDQTMLALQRKFLKQQLEYFAAIHNDHTDKRHVHVVALLRGRLTKGHLRELRTAATQQALSQRQTLDREQGITQGQQQPAVKVPHREPRSVPVFVSREPQRVDAPAPRVLTAGQLQSSTHRHQASDERLEISTPKCPVCKSRNMVREGSRLRCITCGLSVEAQRSLTAKLKAQAFEQELFLEEVGMP
jgi:ribosomal protein L37AE/L43A